MKIMLLTAAAALSLSVGAASADNESNAAPEYPQINPEIAQAPHREVAQAPVQNVPPNVPQMNDWRQDRRSILLY